jgi:hypothetical protein
LTNDTLCTNILCDEFYTPHLVASGEKNSEIFGEFNKILYSADHMLICRGERLYIFMREHLTFRTVTQTPGQWFGFMPLGEGTTGPVALYGYLKGFRNE